MNDEFKPYSVLTAEDVNEYVMKHAVITVNEEHPPISKEHYDRVVALFAELGHDGMDVTNIRFNADGSYVVTKVLSEELIEEYKKQTPGEGK